MEYHFRPTRGLLPAQSSPAPADCACLEELRQLQELLAKRLDRGIGFLSALAQQTGQDTPEFDRYFSEWLRIKDDCETVCDVMDIFEHTRHTLAWLRSCYKQQGPPQMYCSQENPTDTGKEPSDSHQTVPARQETHEKPD